MNVIDKEKVNTIEENIPKVYHSGRFNVIKDLTYLKGSESGEHIYLDDVSDIEHTLGVKVSSKNIIPYPYYEKSKTHKGITYTVNDDGSVTANGTATGGNSTFYFTKWSLDDKISHLFEDGETYTIRGKSGSARILLHYRDKETNADKYAQAEYSSATFKVDKTKYKYCHLRIQVDEGSTVDNATIYPTIIKSSIKDQSFTLNVPDLTTATLRRCGKNLFDKENIKSGYGLAVSGGLLYTNANYLTSGYIRVKPNTTYAINWSAYKWACCYSGESNSDYTGIDTNSSKYVYVGEAKYNSERTTITTLEDTYYLRFTARLDDLEILQLEEGSTVTDYEEYKGKTYTPDTDGTVEGITSPSPNMTLMTNTKDVIIDCDYYKDIDKAYNKLLTNIALSGGN